MAVDMFLKLDGVKGEAVDTGNKPDHSEEMSVLAWSWGASNTGSTHIATGSGSAKANVQDLSITKWVDKASTDLMIAACNGKHFGDAVLVVRKAGELPLEYLKITMTDVMITAYTTGGSGGEDRLTENVTLNFAKIQMEYFQQNKDGSGTPAGDKTFNIQANFTQK